MNTNLSKTKLIIGLGNPGKKYERTWHNAGFLFISRLKESLEDDYQYNEINKKDYYLVTFPTLDLQLLKPLTFMNNSGDVVQQLLKYSSYDTNEILIAHDDLDLELGNYKIQNNKFPKKHNGINSIQQKTGKTDFNYLRIGVETRDSKTKTQISGEKYVLKKASKEDMKLLQETIDNSSKEVLKSLQSISTN